MTDIKRYISIFAWLSLLLTAQVMSSTIYVRTARLTGTVIAPACKVNSNSTTSIEFGSVRIDQLTSASQTFPVTISCDSLPSGTVLMEIKGNASSFDKQALSTDVVGLGVLVRKKLGGESDIIDLNTFYDVSTTFGLTSKTGTFNLVATLTSDNSTSFAGGDFNASATLVLQIS